MEKKFLISIIFPVFNNKNSIENLINCVKNQSIGFENIELIFIIDKITKKNNKDIEVFSNSFNNIKTLFLNKKCLFPGELKNIGIYNASSEYVMFVENGYINFSDSALELLYENIQKKDTDIIFGNWAISNELQSNNLNKIISKYGTFIKNITEIPEIINLAPSISTKIFKKSIILENEIEFPNNLPNDNLLFISNYLLKSSNALLIDKLILEYSANDDAWSNTICNLDKNYFRGLIESYMEIYFLFESNHNHAINPGISYFKYWLSEFINTKMNLLDRIELLKFGEFISIELLKHENLNLNSDLKLICYLVSIGKYYEASELSNLLNLQIESKKSKTKDQIIFIHEKILQFKNEITKNDYSSVVEGKIIDFSYKTVDFNIELYIFSKFIEYCNDDEFIEALTIIKQFNLFDENYYINKYNYNLDINPLLHYLVIGYKEGKNPNKNFNSIFYKNFYINTIHLSKNPLIYFVIYGINKGEVKINKKIYSKPKYFIDKTIYKNLIKHFSGWGVTDNKREVQLIISLTSYPERMNEIHYTLYSLLNQSLKPDKVILWLAKTQFPNGEKDIPNNVINLKKNGLSICWCDDLRSYKKIIPSLKKYPDHIIITADDDLFYPRHWLKNLYETYENNKKCIISHRIRKILIKNNTISKYNDWTLSLNEEPASFLNFSTNGAGTLFPPHSLHEKFFKSELFNELCPHADDIWIWAMAILNNTKIKGVKNNFAELTYVNLARELGILNQKTLYSYNRTNNDKQLNNVLKKYPEILNKLIN